MKVMYILHTSLMGGATISFDTLAIGQINEGVEIVVITPDISQGFKDFIDHYNIKVYKIPVRTCYIKDLHYMSKVHWVYSVLKFIYQRVAYYFTGYMKLLSIIKRERPDIIHTNVGVVQDGFYAAKKLGIPHVWHIREYQDIGLHYWIYPSKKKLCNLFQQSFVISITKDILKHYSLKEDSRHRPIYDGIISEKNICYQPAKEKYFLCASRVSPEKGLEDVIKAFAIEQKKHPEYRLKILGFGVTRYIDYLEQLAKELGCLPGIDFLGYSSDVSPYMQKAKALIVASKFEGLGRMTAEAFFNGCMVIGRNTGGTKEILDQTGGLQFEGDYKALAERMEDVIKMPEQEYKDTVMKGQEIAIQQFSIETSARRIHSFYLDILKESNESENKLVTDGKSN